jgi:hypothetical protein
MRVMLMIKGDPEPGAAPSEELLAAMGRYNDELKEAGVLLDLSGLYPSAGGRRVKFSEGNRTVINGPFAEPKKLVAGYWILQVKSMGEAVEWAKRVPFEALSRIYPGEYGAVGEIEIRQLFEPESSDASN